MASSAHNSERTKSYGSGEEAEKVVAAEFKRAMAERDKLIEKGTCTNCQSRRAVQDSIWCLYCRTRRERRSRR